MVSVVRRRSSFDTEAADDQRRPAQLSPHKFVLTQGGRWARVRPEALTTATTTVPGSDRQPAPGLSRLPLVEGMTRLPLVEGMTRYTRYGSSGVPRLTCPEQDTRAGVMWWQRGAT